MTRSLLAFLFAATAASAAESPPNIVYILADDLGYGDVQRLNPAGRIPTPNLDALAAAGMAFTDAHSSSAVCSPTRYGIMTGRYCWRTRLKSGVLEGYSPRLVEPGRMTVASLLKSNGYRTACVGKWHLGMSWPMRDGGFATTYADGWKVDYSRPIADGPLAVGFDEYYGISASLDMPPFVFIENDRCVGVPTVEKTWVRKGPAHADFEAVDVLPTLTRKAVEFVERQGAAKAERRPFLLYVPLNAPHTPILPTAPWQGKSGLNAYGDFVMQVDAQIGQILAAIDRAGLAGDTLVVVTSDNGCSPAAKIPELLAKGHDPSAGHRGAKADIYDGGHRVPFIVRWPGRVKAGSTCDHIVCLNDLLATCAEIVGVELPADAGEDSVSMLAALKGTAVKSARDAVVHHSINGSFAIRDARHKLAFCPGSGGWSAPRPNRDDASKLPPTQLFDLIADVVESKNLVDERPEIVARMTRLLESYVENGRSTSGAKQANFGEIDIRKAGKAASLPPKK